MLFVIGLIVFIILCIKEACEPTLPADYHNNWKLEQLEDEANCVRAEWHDIWK